MVQVTFGWIRVQGRHCRWDQKLKRNVSISQKTADYLPPGCTRVEEMVSREVFREAVREEREQRKRAPRRGAFRKRSPGESLFLESSCEDVEAEDFEQDAAQEPITPLPCIREPEKVAAMFLGTMSENDRISMPAEFGQRLGLKPGDKILFLVNEDGEILLHFPRCSSSSSATGICGPCRQILRRVGTGRR